MKSTLSTSTNGRELALNEATKKICKRIEKSMKSFFGVYKIQELHGKVFENCKYLYRRRNGHAILYNTVEGASIRVDDSSDPCNVSITGKINCNDSFHSGVELVYVGFTEEKGNYYVSYLSFPQDGSKTYLYSKEKIECSGGAVPVNVDNGG